jgi:hypothetical protein
MDNFNTFSIHIYSNLVSSDIKVVLRSRIQFKTFYITPQHCFKHDATIQSKRFLMKTQKCFEKILNGPAGENSKTI